MSRKISSRTLKFPQHRTPPKIKLGTRAFTSLNTVNDSNLKQNISVQVPCLITWLFVKSIKRYSTWLLHKEIKWNTTANIVLHHETWACSWVITVKTTFSNVYNLRQRLSSQIIKKVAYKEARLLLPYQFRKMFWSSHIFIIMMVFVSYSEGGSVALNPMVFDLPKFRISNPKTTTTMSK